MSSANVEMTRHAWEAAANGDREGFIAHLHPEIVWHSLFGPLSEQSIYHGPEAVAKLIFDEVPSVLEGYSYEPLEIEDIGDDAVLSSFKAKGLGGAGGAEVEQVFFQVARIRDGLAIESHAYTSRAEALDSVKPHGA